MTSLDEAKKMADKIQAKAKEMSTQELLRAIRNEFWSIGHIGLPMNSNIHECVSWDQYQASVHLEEAWGRLTALEAREDDCEIVTTYSGDFSRHPTFIDGDPTCVCIELFDSNGVKRVLYKGINFDENKHAALVSGA